MNTGFAAFRYREYRYFWLAAAFSNVGMWALVYGRLWLMHDLTHRPVMVGLVTTATLGPVLLLSMWGGVIADRVNRLRLVRFTRSLFAALTLLTALLILYNVIEPWHLIAISVATGVLLSFDIPSRAAMVPALVPKEHIASAIALYSFVFGGASIIGPVVFAPMVNAWGLESLFFLIASMYVLTVAALAAMTPEGHTAGGARSGIVRGLLEGFAYVRSHRTISGLIGLGIATGIFGSGWETLLPRLADDVYGGGAGTYGRLLLAAGIGGLAATSVIALLGVKVRPAAFLVAGGIGYGLALVAVSQIAWLYGALFAVGLLGVFRVVFGIMEATLVQALTDDQFRGRVMSINQLTWGASALGSVMMGALAQSWSTAGALALGGSLVVAATAVMAMSLFGVRAPGAVPAAPPSDGSNGRPRGR